ncbi:unnamed protein product [Brachionus calyciflorus]|uniref:Uncharacterized protein n=1 Tax=Brachionus calyciflorus TaxID=104777 RepID=A0A813U9W3_9BILA|nr:unnamed protein product [Brachionus calyciflorus]
MKLLLLIAALTISINALPSFYGSISDQKNVRNFQQFIIHFISPTNFLAHYAEWSIITHTGHDLLGDEFDELFDKLSLYPDAKIREVVSILNSLLTEVLQLEANYEDDYHTPVSQAIDKLNALL